MWKYLFIILLITIPALAGADEEQAVQYATLAAYKQSGLETRVNELIDIYIPEDIKKTAEHIAPLVQAIVSQRVEYKWTF